MEQIRGDWEPEAGCSVHRPGRVGFPEKVRLNKDLKVRVKKLVKNSTFKK